MSAEDFREESPEAVQWRLDPFTSREALRLAVHDLLHHHLAPLLRPKHLQSTGLLLGDLLRLLLWLHHPLCIPRCLVRSGRAAQFRGSHIFLLGPPVLRAVIPKGTTLQSSAV